MQSCSGFVCVCLCLKELQTEEGGLMPCLFSSDARIRIRVYRIGVSDTRIGRSAGLEYAVYICRHCKREFAHSRFDQIPAALAFT